MSPEAIDLRFRRLSGLYQFATTLKTVKWLGKVKDLEVQPLGQKARDSDQGGG